MRKFILGIILFIPFYSFSQSQTFNGKLTYRIDHVKKLTAIDTNFLGIDWLRKIYDSAYIEIIVRDSKLISKNYSISSGELTNMTYQDSVKAYILDLEDFDRGTDFKLIPGDLHNIRTLKIPDEYKEILGYNCKKYIYIAGGNRFIVWIPVDLPFTKQRSYSKFFDGYFYPHGIAFERTIQFESPRVTCNVLKLVKIDFFNPIDEDFEKFLKEAKKQPKFDPLKYMKN